MKTGHYASAIEEFVAVADIYKETGKRIDYASANRMIGEAYMQIREFDKALEYQQIHLGVFCFSLRRVFILFFEADVAVQEKNSLEEQRALANMGHIYLTKYLDIPNNPNKSSLSSAYDCFMKSLDACKK